VVVVFLVAVFLVSGWLLSLGLALRLGAADLLWLVTTFNLWFVMIWVLPAARFLSVPVTLVISATAIIISATAIIISATAIIKSATAIIKSATAFVIIMRATIPDFIMNSRAGCSPAR